MPKPHSQLPYLPDQKLLFCTESLVSRERELTTRVIRHLAEIQKRRLFSDLGYSSLYSYCTQHLKYSEAQAYYRIGAMKLIEEVPEVEENIDSGKLSLTTASLAQRFLQREPKADKKEIVKKVLGKSKRETEKILFEESSELEKHFVEKEKVVSENLTEAKLYFSDELLAKIQKLKGALAHKKGKLTTAQLIEELCDRELARLSKSSACCDASIPEKTNKTLTPKQKGKSNSETITNAKTVVPFTRLKSNTSSREPKGALTPLRT